MDTKAKSLPKKRELQIQKLDEDTSLPIEGASLKLVEDATDTVIEEWVSDTTIKTIEVELNKTYRLVEVQPASGYEKSKDIIIQPDKDIVIENGNIQTTQPNQVYVGFRYDSVRYVTDGFNPQVVYCINKNLKNPDATLDLVNFDINNKTYPQYLHYSLKGIDDILLNTHQSKSVDKNGLANVLLAGYPNDMFGYKDTYSMTNSSAYSNTQNLIYAILEGSEKEQATTGLPGQEYVNEANYYNNLLSVYRNKPIENADAFVDIYAWIQGTGTPETNDPDKKNYQMLAGITNFYTTYTTKVESKSKKAPTTSVSVEKVWDDTIQVDHTHDEVSVQLYENGIASGNPVVLNASNGWKHTWDNLLQSSIWTVDEVQVKDGYVKKVDNQQNNFTITNTQIVGLLEITKEDADTKQVLQGAIFEVFDEHAQSMGTITTDVNGKGTMQLPYGKYQMKEIQAPTGYQLSNDVYDVEIDQQGKQVYLTIMNKKEHQDDEKPVVDNESDDETMDDNQNNINNVLDSENFGDEHMTNESTDKDYQEQIESNKGQQNIGMDDTTTSNDFVTNQGATQFNTEQQLQNNKEEGLSQDKTKNKAKENTVEKEVVQTSDTTKIYVWWIFLACSMLIVTCSYKYKLNKNKR